ncbi:hypothetical protein BCR39DRAFT_492689 [Naematelia encephala]|uniref:B30.2/SPRY domain-containing protein n=1 Tax=Naematelia encephala TaxID=71784 RepID=A0A1Y2BCX6_9TREE|nr:hypothetical protein BCR39DRAFT_492689 [Naematelia encephala]
MSSKKRRLSPSASSSSSTPAPALPTQVSLGLPSASSLSTVQPIANASPGRASATPAPPLKEERTVAKPGTIVPGSGDGPGCGDECFLWADLPMNKQGYRYAPCAPSPNPSPNPLIPFYRTLPGPPPSPAVHISWLDRSSFLRVSNDALTVSADRGFRSGRANVSVREGSWYYEVTILRGNAAAGGGSGSGGDSGNAHVRVGWARRETNLDAPVGMDGYGYGIRDVNGEKVHLSRPKPYGGRPFGTGDVIGCLITLPPRPKPQGGSADDPATIKRKRVPLRYKGQLYFEMDEYTIAKEMEALVDRDGKLANAAKAAKVEEEAKKVSTKQTKKSKKTEPAAARFRPLTALSGSKVEFSINGESMGTAFKDLYDFVPLPPVHTVSTGSKKDREHRVEAAHDDGTLGYFPMVSCFGKGKVKANFGPNLSYLPAGARPMIERWEEWRKEEEELDERDEAATAEVLRKQLSIDEARQKANNAAVKAKDRNGSVMSREESSNRKKAGIKAKKRKGNTVDLDGQSAAATPTPGPEEMLGVKIELESRAPSEVRTDLVESRMPSEIRSEPDGLAEGEMDVEVDVKDVNNGNAEEEDAEEGVKW